MMMTLLEESAEDQLIIFKGATYQLSPLNITLSALVISHNIIILHDYFKDRAKFVPSLFMGIALSDILNAQGLLIISVISILVFTGVLSESVLYRSLYYYMITGLPGYSCSRLFNLLLSLTLTVHLADPFRRLNSERLRTITLVLSVILALLHISNAVCSIAVTMRYELKVNPERYVELVAWFEFPGLVTAATVYCMSSDGVVQDSRCNHPYGPMSVSDVMGALLFLIYYILPPLLTLVCMIIQVFHLRRKLPESSSSLTSASRHASITVIMISLLFFVCHTTFLIVLAVIAIKFGFGGKDDKKYPSLSHQGNIVGAVQFTLPLLYAAVYPIILIVRKPELRERYANFYRRIKSCCRR